MKNPSIYLIATLLAVAPLVACTSTAAPAPTPPAVVPAAAVAPAVVAPAAAVAPAAVAPAAVAPAAVAPAGMKPSDMKFITVVKSMGFNWFLRMQTGVQQYAKDSGVQAVEQGPSKADAALQVQVIEDAIAQKPQALLVVPYEVDSVEPVLKKAQDQNITVITHEASTIQNATYDIEAFDNAGYGRHIMDEIATCTGGEGKYVVFVGSLTSQSHNEWVDSAIAYQIQQYPKMQLVGGKNESKEDIQVAYQITKDLLKTYPDIKGVQGSAANDVVGAGQAIQEAGLGGKVCVAGTSIPSYAGDLLKAGVIQVVNTWDPATAGYAMNKTAQMLLEGKKITDGMDLGVPGYNKIKLVGKVIYGSGWIDITKDNMDQYPF